VRGFLAQTHNVWLDLFDGELRSSTGLVEESRYQELFERYVMHVSLWVKGERYRDEVTGEYSDPDQNLMHRIEEILDVSDEREFRRNLINLVAAHAIDNPGQRVDHTRVFPRYLEQVKEAYFGERRSQLATIVSDMLALLSEQARGLEREARQQAQRALDRLKKDYGYCDACARASLDELLRERYQ
jgi:predicted Ser/Thr protein kinase